MALQISKTFQVNEPVEKVWSFLSDPMQVAACVPGAQITEKVDDQTYKGAISVKVGPSVTDYKGEVQIVRLDNENHEIEILGKGRDVRGRGSASMKMTGKLRALDNGGTEVISTSEFFFFNDTATTEIYTLSLHDALPISLSPNRVLPGAQH